MSVVKIRWQACDGYVGKDRPQETTIDASEFEGLSRSEAENLLSSIMEDEFRQTVTWECDDYEGAVDELMKAAKESPNDKS